MKIDNQTVEAASQMDIGGGDQPEGAKPDRTNDIRQAQELPEVEEKAEDVESHQRQLRSSQPGSNSCQRTNSIIDESIARRRAEHDGTTRAAITRAH